MDTKAEIAGDKKLGNLSFNKCDKMYNRY